MLLLNFLSGYKENKPLVSKKIKAEIETALEQKTLNEAAVMLGCEVENGEIAVYLPGESYPAFRIFNW